MPTTIESYNPSNYILQPKATINQQPQIEQETQQKQATNTQQVQQQQEETNGNQISGSIVDVLA